MANYKSTDKFTVVYFGDANSTIYPSKVVTKATLKKWKETNSKNLKDIATIIAKPVYETITNVNFEELTSENAISIVKILG